MLPPRIVAFAFLAVTALAGCSRNDKTATHEPVSTTTVTSVPLTLTTPADEQLDRALATMLDEPPLRRFSIVEGDERTQFHVQMALMLHLDLVEELSDLDVQVAEGVVTLRGTTSSPEARTSIERIASQQPGVVSIEDQLRIRR